MRRQFSEMLVDLAAAALPFGEAESMLRVTSLALDVPVEMLLRRTASEPELLGDVPNWRWQTGWEAPRGRLRIRWEEGEEF